MMQMPIQKKVKLEQLIVGIVSVSFKILHKLLDGYSAEFVMPDVLIEESIKADSVLCY